MEHADQQPVGGTLQQRASAGVRGCAWVVVTDGHIAQDRRRRFWNEERPRNAPGWKAPEEFAPGHGPYQCTAVERRTLHVEMHLESGVGHPESRNGRGCARSRAHKKARIAAGSFFLDSPGRRAEAMVPLIGTENPFIPVDLRGRVPFVSPARLLAADSSPCLLPPVGQSEAGSQDPEQPPEIRRCDDRTDQAGAPAVPR